MDNELLDKTEEILKRRNCMLLGVRGMYTDYDKMRDDLREDLKICLSKAKELVVSEDVWGYDDMPTNYAIRVYLAIENALEKI